MDFNKKLYIVARYRFARLNKRYKNNPSPRLRMALSEACALFNRMADARILHEGKSA